MLLSFHGGCGESAASDQNIDFEVIENDRFESMVEIVNMSQWKCALIMTAMVKPYAQIEPFQVSKGKEICFIKKNSVIVLKKKCLFFVIAAVRDSPVLDILIWVSKNTNIMIGETFMHLKASLFDYQHSLHHITSVFVPFFFSYPPPGTRGLQSFGHSDHL